MQGFAFWEILLMQVCGVALCGTAIWFCFTRYRKLKPYGNPVGLLLSGAAVSLGFAFVITRIFVVYGLATFASPEQALAVFTFINLHLTVPVVLITSLPFLIGYFLAMEWLVRLVEGQDETTRQLEAELKRRQKLEVELSQALQNAEAANEVKSEFLATISHEVRTPLNSVIGFSDVLLMGEHDEETQRMHELIREGGDILLNLLNEILDVSKIEAGKMELDCQEFDLSKTITDVEDFWRDQFDDQVEFCVKVGPNLQSSLVGDELRLRQIIDNLVGNAQKFTSQGSVTLSIEGEEFGEDYALRLSVADTGIGLSPSQQSKIFEPFTQADQSVTRAYGGTGLGLTICHSLAEQMGGEIEVTSERGKGSVFSVFLMLARPDEVGRLLAS